MEVFVLSSPVCAVKIASNREGAGAACGLVTIPSGAVLMPAGQSTLSGMVDVHWNEDLYALFSVDLETRATATRLYTERIGAD